MRKTINENKKFILLMFVLICVIMAVAVFFGNKKQGYHYDENYSYYSSNVTDGLTPTDNEWKDTDTIKQEFYVTSGRAFDYKMVKTMQTYDVHPPFYYYVLHTVCSLTSGRFSKWQGLAVNLFFLLGTLILLAQIAFVFSKGNKLSVFFTIALFGLSPAIISGVTFIRMYMMLTFICMWSFYIHIKRFNGATLGIWNFYIPVFVSTYIGFMTHYYYVVFLFFMAAYMCIYLFVSRNTRKQSFIYAGCVCMGLILGVVTYPSCLSHIFRGYRGTEAIGAFADMGNIKERAGLFVGLLDEYVLCKSFYVLLLVFVLLLIAVYYKGKKSGKKWNNAYAFAVVTAIGYFGVVLKTALQNAEEAVRYEMPIYGIIILLFVVLIGRMAEILAPEKMQKFYNIVLCMIWFAVVILQCDGLCGNKVLFLYETDKDSYEWAASRHDSTVVYIYDYPSYWKIWDDAHELMEYDRIFFIDMNNSDEINDTSVIADKPLYIYSVRSEEADKMLDKIIDTNPNVTEATKVRELKFADVYEVK